MADPPRIRENVQIWKAGTGQDPARYLIDPGEIKGPNNHSAGNLGHARPYITNGAKLFDFPVGPEGFRRAGQAGLGLHHYIGGEFVAGNTIHFEEGRIELNGVLPGITSQDKMADCLEILTTPQRNGLMLFIPGVFDPSLKVLPENWDFAHEPEDTTHSINYTISFLIIGEGKKVKDPKGKAPGPQPVRNTKHKGKPHKVFVVKDGARTLRAIARIVYKDADLWKRLVKLNQGQLNHWKKDHPKVTTHQLPTYRWPVGTKFRY